MIHSKPPVPLLTARTLPAVFETQGATMDDKRQIAVLIGRALGKGLIWLIAWKLGNQAVDNLGVTPDALFDAFGVLALVGLNVYDSVKTRNTAGKSNTGEYSPPRQ